MGENERILQIGQHLMKLFKNLVTYYLDHSVYCYDFWNQIFILPLRRVYHTCERCVKTLNAVMFKTHNTTNRHVNSYLNISIIRHDVVVDI